MENISDILVWLGLGGVLVGYVARVVLKKKPPNSE